MKNSILTLLLVALSYMAYSQKSYLDNNPEWYVESECAGLGGSMCLENNSYNLRIGNDSIINDTIYKKVEGSHSYTYTELGPNGSCSSTDYTAFSPREALIRQEGEKLYIYDGFGNDQLLYDFSLQVGDTLPDSYVNSKSENIVIDSIIDIVYNGDSLKKFMISTKNGGFILGEFIIEGIGSNVGLLKPLGMPFECGSNLNCYKNSSKQALNFNGGGGCNFAVSVNEIENRRLKLYPNPASNYLLVESTQGSLGSIEVYNLQGKKLNLALLKLSEKSIRIDLNHLNTGVYFIKDVNIGKTYKVVKQ